MAEHTTEEIIDWMRNRISQDLHCAPEDIDPDANYDALGLDSLAILIATGELAEWLDTQLEAATLFEHPTIRALATHLNTG